MAPSANSLPPPISTERRPSSIPMQELEPSPVDEEPSEDPEKVYFPSPPSSASPASSDSSIARSSTSFLGLFSSPHPHLPSVPHTLALLQKYSVVPPSLYLISHLTTTALIPLTTRSAAGAEKYLLLFRPYYQTWPIEPLMIFAPIATHVLSGIALRIYRRRASARRHGAETHADRRSIPWPKLSLTSALGYALYPMMVAHVLVNRVVPMQTAGDSSGVGLRYFGHGIAKHPWILNAAYVAMLGVASWHFVTGAATFLKLTPEYITGEDKPARKRSRAHWINGLAAVLAGTWIAGGLGVVGRAGIGSGWEARQWDDLLTNVPVIGSWL